jgi:hypothetical protein
MNNIKRLLFVPFIIVLSVIVFSITVNVLSPDTITSFSSSSNGSKFKFIADIVNILESCVCISFVVNNILLKKYWIHNDTKNAEFNKFDFSAIKNPIFHYSNNLAMRNFAFEMHKQFVLHNVSQSDFEYALSEKQFGDKDYNRDTQNVFDALNVAIDNFSQDFDQEAQHLKLIMDIIKDKNDSSVLGEYGYLNQLQIINLQKTLLIPLGLQVTKYEFEQIFALLVQSISGFMFRIGGGLTSEEFLKLHNITILVSNKPEPVHNLFLNIVKYYSDSNQKYLLLFNRVSDIVRA